MSEKPKSLGPSRIPSRSRAAGVPKPAANDNKPTRNPSPIIEGEAGRAESHTADPNMDGEEWDKFSQSIQALHTKKAGAAEGQAEADPAGEKKVKSFMREAWKDPALIDVRNKAAAAKLAYENQEGGWRYGVRMASRIGTLGLSKGIGGGKLEKLKAEMEAAQTAWEQKVGEKMQAAYALAQERAAQSVENIDPKNPQGKNFARIGSKKVLERYRGMLAASMVKGEMTQMFSEKNKLREAQQDNASIYTKALTKSLTWYANQPRWRKLVIGTVAGTGIASAVGVAGVGAGAIATYGAWRAARVGFSIYVGSRVIKKSGEVADKLSFNRTRENRRAAKTTEATRKGAQEFRQASEGDRTLAAQNLMREYRTHIDKNVKAIKADNRRKLLVQALAAGGVGGAAFAGSELIASNADSLAPIAKAYGYGVANKPIDGASAITRINPGGSVAGGGVVAPPGGGSEIPPAPPASPSAPTLAAGNDYLNDPRNPFRGIAKQMEPRAGAPGEQDNVTGVDNAVRQHWVYNEPGKAPAGPQIVGAPGEQDNVTGVDNAVRQHWVYNEPGKAPVEPSAPKPTPPIDEPSGRRGVFPTHDIPGRPSFSEPAIVQPGSNLSYILKEGLQKSGHLDGLSPKQADTLVGLYVDHISHLSAAEKAALGFRNPDNLGLVYPGDKLDLRLVNNENLYAQFVGTIKGIPEPVRGAVPVEPAKPAVEAVPQGPSAAEISQLGRTINAEQIRSIFSTRSGFGFGPRTDGMQEFNRVSWQRADNFISQPPNGADPSLTGVKAEQLRQALVQAERAGVKLKGISIKTALEQAAQLEASRILNNK